MAAKLGVAWDSLSVRSNEARDLLAKDSIKQKMQRIEKELVETKSATFTSADQRDGEIGRPDKRSAFRWQGTATKASQHSRMRVSLCELRFSSSLMECSTRS